MIQIGEYKIKVRNDKLYINRLQIQEGGCCPKFTAREIDIMKSRLQKDKVTFKALGDKYGVSRERIRQQYNNTIKKMIKRYEAWIK